MEPHLMIIGSRKNHSDKDFYETPCEAIDRLFAFWRPQEDKIWEPCCGRGAISEVLKKYGYTVVSTDIEDRGYSWADKMNYLEIDKPLAPFVMTNPPYNRSFEFVKHTLDTVGKGMFLLRLQWLEGEKRRQKLFDKHYLKSLFVFSKRIPRMHVPDYDGKKVSSTIAFGWFLFDKNNKESTTVHWLP